MTLQIVPIEHLSAVWPKVESWIEDAIAEGPGDEGPLDVLIGLARGQYLLWWQPDVFAAVVQVVQWPRQKVATVLYAGGGDLEQIRAAFERFMDLSRASGVQVIRIQGRRGWERALGAQRISSVCEVRL